MCLRIGVVWSKAIETAMLHNFFVQGVLIKQLFEEQVKNDLRRLLFVLFLLRHLRMAQTDKQNVKSEGRKATLQ